MSADVQQVHAESTTVIEEQADITNEENECGNKWAGFSIDQVELRIYLMHNPSPYSWALEIEDSPNPRTVTLKDIFQMEAD